MAQNECAHANCNYYYCYRLPPPILGILNALENLSEKERGSDCSCFMLREGDALYEALLNPAGLSILRVLLKTTRSKKWAVME
jgi:hypothetical protein